MRTPTYVLSLTNADPRDGASLPNDPATDDAPPGAAAKTPAPKKGRGAPFGSDQRKGHFRSDKPNGGAQAHNLQRRAMGWRGGAR